MPKKQKSGLYCSKVVLGTDANGVSIVKWISGRTKRELKAERARVISYYVDGNDVNRDYFFEDYAVEWYESYKKPHVRETTQSNYRNAINKHLIPAFGGRQMRAMIYWGAVVCKWACQLLQIADGQDCDGASGNLQARCNRGIVDRNPALAITRPECKEGSRRALTPDERKTVLDVCENHPDGLLFLLLYYTGMRRSEALGLQWRDVNLTDDVIHVSRALTYAGKPILGAPKTKGSERDIPIPRPLHNQLLRCQGVGERFVIGARNGGAISESSLQRKAARLVDAIGIPDLTCYILRHNYLTMLDEAHVAPTTAMCLAGHEDYQTTVKFYTHIQSEQFMQAKTALEEVFGGAK